MVARAEQRLDGLEGADLGSWGGFLRTYSTVVGRLDTEMRDAHGLSLSAYEVLMRLGRADGRRLRMCDLAAAVLLTPSGITRVVDRLEREGLVTRCGHERDGRSRNAVLTDKGFRKLVDAQRTHLAGVREAFLDRLTPRERERLAAVWERLATEHPT